MPSPLLLPRPLVIFDTETTGLDVGVDHIWEIAAMRVEPDGDVFGPLVVQVQHSTLLARRLPDDFRRKYVIRHNAASAVTPDTAAKWFIDHFLDPTADGTKPHLAGLSVDFDTALLRRIMRGHAPWDYRLLDVRALAIGYLAGTGHSDIPVTTDDLAQLLGVTLMWDRHTAEGDVRLAWSMLSKILRPEPEA